MAPLPRREVPKYKRPNCERPESLLSLLARGVKAPIEPFYAKIFLWKFLNVTAHRSLGESRKVSESLEKSLDIENTSHGHSLKT